MSHKTLFVQGKSVRSHRSFLSIDDRRRGTSLTKNVNFIHYIIQIIYLKLFFKNSIMSIFQNCF